MYMKKYAAIIYRKLLSPSMRFELRESVAWLQERHDRACLWRWEIARLPQLNNSPYSILYVCRKVHREVAKILLGGKGVIDTDQTGTNLSSRTVFVSEMPVPGALRVPQYLRAIVSLGRPVEEIMAGYDGELRRSLRKHRARYRMQQALGDAEIDHAVREMIQPYARAGLGSSANKRAPEIVRRFAKVYLHCVRTPDESLLEKLRSIYMQHKFPLLWK